MKLFNKKKSEETKENVQDKKEGIINSNQKSLKDLIAPAGVDATNVNHIEIIANRKGKLMDFKGTYLFDGLNGQNIEEIPRLVYNAYNH